MARRPGPSNDVSSACLFEGGKRTGSSMKESLSALFDLYFFDRGYRGEEETGMLAQGSKGMRDLAERYGSAMEDPQVISRYEWLEDAKHEEASRLAVAERRGEKRGERRGAERKGLEIAGRMKGMGMSPDDIAAACGLTREQVDALKAE